MSNPIDFDKSSQKKTNRISRYKLKDDLDHSNPQEIAREIRAIQRKLKQSTSTLRKHTDLMQIGAERLEQFNKRLKNYMATENIRYLKNVELGKLNSLYREIAYISQLKSTNIKDISAYTEIMAPIKEHMEALSPDIRRVYSEVYNKLVDEFQMYERFRYEIYETVDTYVKSGITDSDLIVKSVRDMYESNYFEHYTEGEEEIGLHFTETLRDFSRTFN